MSKELIERLRHRAKITSGILDARFLSEAVDLIEQQASEIEALKHDMTELLQISRDVASDNEALLAAIRVVTAIPSMTDSQLEELRANCQAVISQPSAHKQPADAAPSWPNGGC